MYIWYICRIPLNFAKIQISYYPFQQISEWVLQCMISIYTASNQNLKWRIENLHFFQRIVLDVSKRNWISQRVYCFIFTHLARISQGVATFSFAKGAISSPSSPGSLPATCRFSKTSSHCRAGACFQDNKYSWDNLKKYIEVMPKYPRLFSLKTIGIIGA